MTIGTRKWAVAVTDPTRPLRENCGRVWNSGLGTNIGCSELHELSCGSSEEKRVDRMEACEISEGSEDSVGTAHVMYLG